MAKETVRGRDVTIHFDGQRCIHSRNCVLLHPDVFVPNVPGEWIHPDAVSPEEVALVARACPSGAITYERTDGGPQEPAPLVNQVRTREDGPLAFRATLRIAGEDAGFRATLCRCGLSKDKPYCDGSHATGGFVASGERAPQESQPLAMRDGGLDVEPQKNGPLHVIGNLEVVTGTGHTVDRTTETWLCRCGHSGNKPFCDGSHAKVGFQADGI
ncbi:MAG: CDGSH iron-sulfur domain-containing protein [Xanthomonadaceae bacterium]|nr:CDGSH iron-sulfur domain-containing protein [Xanthomonadaceae bacterium]